MFALPSFCVLFAMSNTTKGELPPAPALTAESGVRPGLEQASFLGHSLGCLHRENTNRNLGHVRTHTGRRSCERGSIVFRVNRCLFHNILLGVCPTHFKKKGKTKQFTLSIPFCCLCLFCFALLFFPYVKTTRVRKFCPAACWDRPFHSSNQEPFVLGSEWSSDCLVTCVLALLP